MARAKLRDSEKMPAPTIDPTTIAVNAGRESFGSVSDAIAHPPLRKRKSMRKDTDANAHYNLPPCCGGGAPRTRHTRIRRVIARPLRSLVRVPLDAAGYSPPAEPPSRPHRPEQSELVLQLAHLLAHVRRLAGEQRHPHLVDIQPPGIAHFKTPLDLHQMDASLRDFLVACGKEFGLTIRRVSARSTSCSAPSAVFS
ncbi:hypothetical protein [Paraburkholderia sp. DGU8]|uniref:hypothetical protein n=1 Tax=Paraburkholderia sp. DGU8 TaxID=3161997 RepID=UPI003466CCE6